jgi:hypothetical protein
LELVSWDSTFAGYLTVAVFGDNTVNNDWLDLVFYGVTPWVIYWNLIG